MGRRHPLAQDDDIARMEIIINAVRSMRHTMRERIHPRVSQDDMTSPCNICHLKFKRSLDVLGSWSVETSL